jgi:hypothetical protein
MPDNRTILVTERIETTNTLFDRLHRAFPGQISRYHSHMSAPEKERALNRYRDGESRVIVCCHALDEGLNVPETDAGVILSVGGGMRQRIQRVGRILRRGGAGGTKKIYYLYISDGAEAPELLPGEDPEPGTDSAPGEDGGKADGTAYQLAWTESGELLPDPAYGALAEGVLARLARSGASESRLRNAKRQLDRGSVRTDFLLPESVCLERLRGARPEERDYLIAMLLMARMREGAAE